MPGTYLGYPFDEEIFLMNWQAEVDPVLTALLDSGIMTQNGTIASMIRNGSNQYTIPFYNVLTGKDDNYNGVDDITVSDPDGAYQTGVVYGRAHAWRDRDFINDFNSGANPMIQISRQVARYWHKRRQERLIGILTAIFGITSARMREAEGSETPPTPTKPGIVSGPQSDENYYHDGDWTTEWAMHTLDISASGGTRAVDESNKVGEASAAEAMQKACGDSSNIFSMSIMHSAVALGLAKKNLLQFRKYTDSQGIERTLNLADWNGLSVIVDDGVPHASGKYTTYIMGTGALSFATAPVKTPVELSREPLKNGGFDVMVTRFRETIHPNGFSFILPKNTISPEDSDLATTANWKVVTNPKVIPMARIISNG